MKNKLSLVFIGFVLFATGHAQQEKSDLNVPKEYEEVGQKVYEGLEFMFSKVSEYAKTCDHISKAGMDSVSKAAIQEYAELYPQTQDALSGATKPDSTANPKRQALLNDVQAAIKSASPTQPDKLRNKLGKINLKAGETLSETDAAMVYIASCTSYYSFKYWTGNATNWQSLGEYVKQKIKQ